MIVHKLTNTSMPQVQTHRGFRKIATMSCHVLDFPCGSDGKESICKARDPGLIPGLGRSPGEEKWQSTPVFLPREFHRHRSLVGYSPWGHKELDTTEL